MLEVCHFHDQTCQGRLEWHHVVSKSRIKRRYPLGAVYETSSGAWRPLGRREEQQPSVMYISQSELLGDPRNRIWLCTHHHERVTNARLYPETPAEALEFADDYGFTSDLEKDEMRRRPREDVE